GFKDFRVLKPAASESVRSDAQSFTLRTADLDPLVLTELLEPSEAQERRLLEVIEWLLHAAEKAGKTKKAPSGSGGPGSISEALAGKSPGQVDVPYTLQGLIDTIDEWAFVGKPTKEGHSKPAAGADLHSYLAL